MTCVSGMPSTSAWNWNDVPKNTFAEDGAIDIVLGGACVMDINTDLLFGGTPAVMVIDADRGMGSLFAVVLKITASPGFDPCPELLRNVIQFAAAVAVQAELVVTATTWELFARLPN